jgi:hypothetical protein
MTMVLADDNIRNITTEIGFDQMGAHAITPLQRIRETPPVATGRTLAGTSVGRIRSQTRYE